MKYWFGYPVRECECGFSTPDEDEFNRHLARKGHKPKAEPAAKPAGRKAKAVKAAEPAPKREENNGIQDEPKDEAADRQRQR